MPHNIAYAKDPHPALSDPRPNTSALSLWEASSDAFCLGFVLSALSIVVPGSSTISSLRVEPRLSFHHALSPHTASAQGYSMAIDE